MVASMMRRMAVFSVITGWVALVSTSAIVSACWRDLSFGYQQDSNDAGDGGCVPSYRNAVLTANPSVYYRFDETDGIFRSESADRNAPVGRATDSGGVTRTSPGAIAADDGGGAIDFDGGFIDFGKAEIFDRLGWRRVFSIELWILPGSAMAGWQRVFSKEKSAPPGISLVYHGPPNPTLAYYRSHPNNSGTLSISGIYLNPSSDSPYTHLVITNDGTTFRVYVNGKERNTIDTPLDEVRNDASFFLGGAPNLPAFVGAIDELAIYPRDLQITEVVQHYCAGSPGDPDCPRIVRCP